jgi:hypothetical protein
MMPHPPPDPASTDRIDAYLDGAMAAPERAAFEKDIASNPALGEQVALQRHIDSRLRDLFAPPAAPSLPAAQPTRAVAGRIGFPLWAKAAAAIALVAIGAWLAVARPWEGLLKPALAASSADSVLKQLVSDENFKPVWVCDNDQKFLTYTKDKLGVSFLVRPDSGVQLVGWTYKAGLLENTAQILLVRAEGKELMVAMGPKGDDRTQHTVPGSPLHITRKVYKGVVMYEISPLDHPVVVNSIQEP